MTENTLYEKLYTLSQVLQTLNVARHRFNYLFDSRKLKAERVFETPQW